MKYVSVAQGEDLENHTPNLTRSPPPMSGGNRTFTVKQIFFGFVAVLPYVVILLSYSVHSTVSVPAVVSASQNPVDFCLKERERKLDTKRNVYWDSSVVSQKTRFAALKQKGATLWFTGLSGSGKSTVGRALERQLVKNERIHTYRLDGDNVRIGLNRDLGFSPADRGESVRRVGEMAALFSGAGTITLVGLVSPYIKDREKVRVIHKKMGIPFFEVFVNISVDTAIKRDPKGLYKRAIKGEIQNFTGITSPYEKPPNAEIVLNSSEMSVEQEVEFVVNFLRSKGLLSGVDSIPQGYPGIQPVEGGNALSNFTKIYPITTSSESVKPKDEVKILVRHEDVHWIQVIAEGWAAPLKGFMRQDVYLQSLYFQSVMFDSDQLEPDSSSKSILDWEKATNFSLYQKQNLKKGQRISMSLPIVLPINLVSKKMIENRMKEKKGSKDPFRVTLVSPSGVDVAYLKNPEIYPHRKEERITRTFGSIDKGHPYIKEISKSGEFLMGGEIELITGKPKTENGKLTQAKIVYNDGLDKYRKTPAELRQIFNDMKADVVVAFQTRNPTHAGHAYLMNEARRRLLKKGFKNPVLWLSPLGGWTKSDDVPLDVRVKQHEAILNDGSMLDKKSTVLSIWPSPMIYAGPREVIWHAKSRKNAGASYFVVGRDPAGIKRSDKSGDMYDGDHGRYLLHIAPGMEDMNLMSFPKVYYDVHDHQMKPKPNSGSGNFLSISGSKMRKMARLGLQKCSNNKVPSNWSKKQTCVPPGFMADSGWKIVTEYYQNQHSSKWAPYAVMYNTKIPLSGIDKVVDGKSDLPFHSVGTYGKTDYKLEFLSASLNSKDSVNKISPWHDIPLYSNKKSKKIFNFIVEIPKGTMAKMEVNKEHAFNPIMQDSTHNGTRGRYYLYGVPFFNYGLLPQTWEDPSVKDKSGNGGDNDPLDVIEVGSQKLLMGSVNPVKVLGSLELIDQGEVDHKILVIALSDPDVDRINSISDLNKHKPNVISKLVDWLKNYKIPEGKAVNVLTQDTPIGSAEAIDIIEKTHKRWQKLISGKIPNTGFWLKKNPQKL